MILLSAGLRVVLEDMEKYFLSGFIEGNLNSRAGRAHYFLTVYSRAVFIKAMRPLYFQIVGISFMLLDESGAKEKRIIIISVWL